VSYFFGFRSTRKRKSLFELQAQFESPAVFPSQSEHIREILEDMRMHLSNALNYRGRQRATWRNRVIDSVRSINDLSYQILAIWPYKYSDEELDAAAALCELKEQGDEAINSFSRRLLDHDYRIPEPGSFSSKWFAQQASFDKESDDDIGTAYAALCDVVSHATMLQKWFDYAYVDAKPVPEPVVAWLDHLVEEALLLKSIMLDDTTKDKKELSDGEDESPDEDAESSKPPLSHAFGANFDSAHAKKEVPSYSTGDQPAVNPRQNSIYLAHPDEVDFLWKGHSGANTRRSVRDQGAAFFG
jgi:hypothetical protein